jgi:hypothetical protein
MPTIIDFLGYNPLPQATTIGKQLVRHQSSMGKSQKDAAVQIGVGPCTLVRWERGERKPTGDFRKRATFSRRRVGFNSRGFVNFSVRVRSQPL